MFNLAHGYANQQMTAFVELQEAEFAVASKRFTAVKHPRDVHELLRRGDDDHPGKHASPTALKNSTDDESFSKRWLTVRCVAARLAPKRRR